MANALWKVSAVEMECPYCHAEIPAPSGSLFWTVTELSVRNKPLLCDECGRYSGISKRIPGLTD